MHQYNDKFYHESFQQMGRFIPLEICAIQQHVAAIQKHGIPPGIKALSESLGKYQKIFDGMNLSKIEMFSDAFRSISESNKLHQNALPKISNSFHDDDEPRKWMFPSIVDGGRSLFHLKSENGLTLPQEEIDFEVITPANSSDIGTPEWRKKNARKAANAGHAQPGGSRDKRNRVREAWATGQYQSRDLCAKKECGNLGMSLSTARKALRNTPNPKIT